MIRNLPYYFFKEDEEQAFLKACEESPRDHCIWKTLFDSGMRVSELVGDKRSGYRGLYVEDIDFEKQEIRVFGKGEKERMVVVSKQALDEILKWLGDRRSGKVFDITPRMVQKLAKKYAKNAGLPDWDKRGRWSPHKARHTHIAKILDKTRDLPVALKQTGLVLSSPSIPIPTPTEYRHAVMKAVFEEN